MFIYRLFGITIFIIYSQELLISLII